MMAVSVLRSNQYLGSPSSARVLGKFLHNPNPYSYNVCSAADAATFGIKYPFPGFCGDFYQAIAPYPQLAMLMDTYYYDHLYYVGLPLAQSYYDSMVIDLKKRAGKGLTMNLNYTLSRQEGNTYTAFQKTWANYTTIQDFSNIAQVAHTITDYDQTHVVKGFVSYDLPFGRGRQWMSDHGRWVNGLIGGWTVAGLVLYTSGQPLRATVPNPYYAVWGNIYPNFDLSGFIRIEDNEIYHVDRSGIFGWSEEWMRSKWHPSLGVIVRGNQLHDIGADGIVVVATDGALVENNVVGHASQRSEDYNVAIWAWSADNTIIQYNEAYGTKGQRDGEGFDSDWNSRNTVIQYNYSHDNDGGFLLICNEGGHEITENAGNSGTIVRYNISRNDRSRGITIAGPVKNTLVYNNTIYTGPDRTLDMLLFADWNGWSEDTYFFNNIFFAAGPAQFSHGVSRASDGAYTTAPGLEPSKNNIFESNLYYGVNPPPGDKGALTADPKLVDPTRGGMGRFSLSGYHLQPTSAARASGKAIQNNGRRDFWGHAVPSCNKTDRGASQSDNCEAVAAEHHER